VTGGLAWLNDLMVWLARWVPRLTLIKRTHEGVIFGPRGRVSLRGPGLCCYWPITHELQLIGTRRRSLELAAQLHVGEAVSVVVGWFVSNSLTAATSLSDVEAFLDDRTQAALSRAHVLHRPDAEITGQMLRELADEFSKFGVDVFSVDIAQRSWVIPIKNLNDYATHHGSGSQL
jgi:hypothetical protein